MSTKEYHPQGLTIAASVGASDLRRNDHPSVGTLGFLVKTWARLAFESSDVAHAFWKSARIIHRGMGWRDFVVWVNVGLRLSKMGWGAHRLAQDYFAASANVLPALAADVRRPAIDLCRVMSRHAVTADAAVACFKRLPELIAAIEDSETRRRLMGIARKVAEGTPRRTEGFLERMSRLVRSAIHHAPSGPALVRGSLALLEQFSDHNPYRTSELADALSDLLVALPPR